VKREDIAIAGVMKGDPFHPHTWSGSSRYFFEALRERGALAGAVSAELPALQGRLHQALSFHPRRDVWKFKTRIDLGHYRAMTARAEQQLRRLPPGSFSVILQIGAWYDMTGMAGIPAVSYHDGNVYGHLNSPRGIPPVARRHLDRVVAYEGALYRKLRAIFPMSRYLADSFVRDFGVDAAKVHTVGAGVNLPFLGDCRQRDFARQRVLFVGKDFARKGGETLLAAWRRVRARHPEAELQLIGPTVAIAEPGVTVLPPVDKLIEADLARLVAAYAGASVFVMPSLYEPFGIVFCEAMAHRLPCVGTRVCAMPEIIAEGETGFLVPPGDEARLADALIALLDSPALCREMGEQGFARYEANYTWSAVADRILEVITAEL
jgi:glycosyltransferase involved in cell wall biosynthesis